MRRPRSDEHQRGKRALKPALALSLVLAILGAPHTASAQRGTAQDGALFLLIPIGASAVGMGQAVVADRAGSEAVWWNPSALSRLTEPEAAIHHSQNLVATGDAVSLVIPSSVIGVVAASVDILNYGSQDVTTTDGTVGQLLPRSFVYAATYATPIGRRFNAGLTYKVVQLRLDCTGQCGGVPTFSASTSALDFGAQYDFTGHMPLSVGAAVRNVGLRFQVNDNPQSDPLPTRIEIGGLYRLDTRGYARDTQLRLSADLVDKVAATAPTARFGVDAVYKERVHLRGGYDFGEGDASGPSVGLGVTAGSLVMDIARLFRGLSVDAGQPPIYLSLRYVF